MSRLIDADLLEEILDVNIQILQDEIDDARTEVQKIVYEAQLFSTMEMIRVIKEQQTAFDVDKVVEKLRHSQYMLLEEMKNATSYSHEEELIENIRHYEYAINIVKAGGV